ncbi:MAG: hypothetical protein ACI9WU_005311 [Myxococcota bacterium]
MRTGFLVVLALLALGCSSSDESAEVAPDTSTAPQDTASNTDPDVAPDADPGPQSDADATPDTGAVTPDADADSAPDVAVPDTGPPPPAEPTLVAPTAGDVPQITVQSWSEVATSRAWTIGERVIAIQDGVLVAIDEPQGEAVPFDGLPMDEEGEQVAVAFFDMVQLDGVTLALTDAGVFVVPLEGTELVLSPLSGAFADALPRGAVVVPGDESAGPDGWFATLSGLHLWRQSLLYPIQLELPTADALLAWGPKWEGQAALWVAADNSVYAVTETVSEDGGTAGLDAWIETDDLPVDALSADASGRLWAVANGDAHRREVDGSWSWLRLPDPAVAVAGGPADDAAAWVSTDDALWLNAGDAWWSVLPGAWSLRGETEGRVLVSGANGVALVTLGDVPDPPPVIVTWAQDIEPLMDARCSLCHGDGQYAHPMWTRDHWEDEMEDILFVIESQAMPLPPNEPLNAKEIELIVDWKDGEFKE